MTVLSGRTLPQSHTFSRLNMFSIPFYKAWDKTSPLSAHLLILSTCTYHQPAFVSFLELLFHRCWVHAPQTCIMCAIFWMQRSNHFCLENCASGFDFFNISSQSVNIIICFNTPLWKIIDWELNCFSVFILVCVYACACMCHIVCAFVHVCLCVTSESMSPKPMKGFITHSWLKLFQL